MNQTCADCGSPDVAIRVITTGGHEYYLCRTCQLIAVMSGDHEHGIIDVIPVEAEE